MHNNYYFLRQVLVALQNKLTGWQLVTAFTQDKDELILGFMADREEYFIRVSLRSELVCLTFPATFHRARKNSVDLFEQAIGKKVTGVVQYRQDRSFALQLDTDSLLLFKLHGNRSNILLLENDVPVELFQNNIDADWQLKPESLHRNLSPTLEDFIHAQENPTAIYPALGKLPLRWLDQHGFVKRPTAEKWQMLQQLVATLEQPESYQLTYLPTPDSSVQPLPVLSLLPFGEIFETCIHPLDAANRFYSFYARESVLAKEKNQVVQRLEKKKKQTEGYLTKTYEKLNTILVEARNEQMGHILMANLHQIPTNVTSIELHDFYHDKPVQIKLKKDVSPQKNAEIYYRKAKNEKIEIAVLEKSIAQKEQEQARILQQLKTLETIEDIKVLRRFLKDNGLEIEEATPQPKTLFRYYEYMGFEILVGKNSKNNDLLTRQYAWKEDLWLHAKDVSGSHVVIKYQAGKPFPEPVIERAARLAAYYSRRKNDTLCPVTVTPRKYVRKPKGLPDGAVIVDKEKVILVEPADG